MSSGMRLVFMGTPEFAVPSLKALLDDGHDVLEIVTQPDKPAGRGRRLQPSPVKRFALERQLPVGQPKTLRSEEVLRHLEDLRPDTIIVAAYGKILPRAVLELPRHGAINVHASLLPKYRGAAPIQHAILAGETETGITIMQMNERMDEGDVLLQRAEPVRADDTTASLSERLARVGADLLVEALGRLEEGTLRPVPQDPEQATYAPMIRKEDAEIDWSRSARHISRAVRALAPSPGARTRLDGRILKIHHAANEDEPANAAPGTILHARGDDLRVATGDGTLRVFDLQLEGKRRLPVREFLRGGHVREGHRLGGIGGP